MVGEAGPLRLPNIVAAAAPDPDPQRAVDAALACARTAGVVPESLTVVHAGERPVDVALQGLSGASSIAVSGPPLQAILQAASERNAELVVLTTEGRKGWAENFTGSFTERFCAQSPCPVLILPAPDYKAASPV